MNTLLTFLSGKKTYLTCAVVGVLLFGVWQKWWTVPPEIYTALFAAALTFVRLGIAKATPDAAGQSQPTSIPINRIVSVLAFTAGIAGLIGCAQIQPGQDPIVVQVERTETVAKSSFDLALNVDNSNRSMFATNAPGFHKFCEWLREPQTVEQTNTLPRAAALLVSLDDVKLDYKAGRGSSNEVFTVLSTVRSAMNQADAWLTVVTNQPSTH